jgi:hypothetical protein
VDKLLTLLLLVVLAGIAPAAFAQGGASGRQTAAPENLSEPSSKHALYRRFLDNFKDNQPEAVRAAKLYLEQYAADDDEIVRYLKKWVDRYEKATGADGFNLANIACGVRMHEKTYLVRRGGTLRHTVWSYESPELAEAALEKKFKSAEVVERRPILDEQGLKVGERVVVKKAERALVLRTGKGMIVGIEAPSVEVIEEFEKVRRP